MIAHSWRIWKHFQRELFRIFLAHTATNRCNFCKNDKSLLNPGFPWLRCNLRCLSAHFNLQLMSKVRDVPAGQPTGPHSRCICDSRAGAFILTCSWWVCRMCAASWWWRQCWTASSLSHLVLQGLMPRTDGALSFFRILLGLNMQFGHCIYGRGIWKSFRGEQHESFKVQKIRFVDSEDLGNITLGDRWLPGKDKCLKQGKNAFRKEGNNPSVPGKGSEIMCFKYSKNTSVRIYEKLSQPKILKHGVGHPREAVKSSHQLFYFFLRTD